MPHAEHFLTRLDRLAGPEVDLALSLYRDPDLLRAILASVSLPEAADRVAISLGDPNNGPFLVVTRDGHFVTCLGTGMKPGPHPVVTRGQLDALSLKVVQLRERMELATRLVGNKDRACAQLLRRILVIPDRVSREDFLAVSAWQPMLAPALVNIYLAMCCELHDKAPILRSVRKINGNVERAMKEYWDLLHAAGHLCLLATMSGDNERFLELTDNQSRHVFSWGLSSTGITAFILKGAWGAGRMGKALLPAYKKSLAEDGALFELLDTVYSLIAIGRRSSKLRAEIGKELEAAPDKATTIGAQKLRKALNLRSIFKIAAAYMDCDDDEPEASLLQVGNQMLGDDLDKMPVEARNAIARLLPVTAYTDGITHGRHVAYSIMLIAATARGEPEQFYFPRDLLQATYQPWKPEFTQLVLEPTRMAEQASRPMAAARTGPGPNQPCPCGSGRKFKKCCGQPVSINRA